MKATVIAFACLPALFAALIFLFMPVAVANAQQATGTGAETRATYIITIPAGAYQQGSVHFVPPYVSVPTGTTIEFANDDPNQVHTVTSGLPGSSDAGAQFDSGVMAPEAAFTHTFNQSGTYSYFCKLHPWMSGTIVASGAYVNGHNIKMSMGGSPIWNLTKDVRTVLSFDPTSISVAPDQPVRYNITMLSENQTVFAHEFTALGGHLSIELVPSNNTATKVYGPDTNEPVTGAYHIDGSFLKEASRLSIRAQIMDVGGNAPSQQTGDEFGIQVVPEFQLGSALPLVAGIGLGTILVVGLASRRTRGSGSTP